MPHLSIALLGPFDARLDGEPIATFESRLVRALLAYLAVEADRPHPREVLAGLLWPDRPEARARGALRHALSALRRAIGDRDATPPFLLISRDMVQFNAESDYDLDTQAFERLYAAGQGAPGDADALCRAWALYRGPFLEGFSLSQSDVFEEWASLQRERLSRLALQALEALVAHHEALGDPAEALRYARRLVELDPLREEAHRQLMRALALSGQRSAALVQYLACRRVLDQELQVQPADETTALYDAIRQGTLRGPVRAIELAERQAPVAIDQGVVAVSETATAPNAGAPRFVAREAELARLDAWLGEALAGRGRVGLVEGEAGSGKTMLMREFARRAMDAHPELVSAGGTCNAYSGMGDAYLPFLEILRLLAGDATRRQAGGALSREHARLRALGAAALEAVLARGQALIDTLLPSASLEQVARTLPDPDAWLARLQGALSRRPLVSSQTFLFDQVAGVLQGVAERQPLLLILDDLQWADGASIGLLFHLARRLAGAGGAGSRMLVLGAYRPEEVGAGRGGETHPLQRVLYEIEALWGDDTVDLALAEGRALVEALVDTEPNHLGRAFRDALYRQTTGHALFTVELLRGLEARGALVRDAAGCWIESPKLDWGGLPKRVEAVIAAQIARLSWEEQELLAAASVEGSEFHAEVVARVLGRDVGDVVAALSSGVGHESRLVMAHSLRAVGEQRFSRYRFRHDLFQAYLYDGLDPVRRAHLHGAVAAALQALRAVPACLYASHDLDDFLLDDRTSLVSGPEPIVTEAAMARHWEQAGALEEAAHCYFHAGMRIINCGFDYPQVLSLMAKALELHSALEETPSRLYRLQALHHCVAWGHATTKGWTAPEAEAGWQQALAAAERSGEASLIADALTWLAMQYRARRELDAAMALHERALTLTQQGLPGWAHWVEGQFAWTLILRGDPARAQRLLAPLIEALLGEGTVPPPWLNGELTALAPWALWALGYPDQAMQVGVATLEMVRRETDRFQITMEGLAVLSGICWLHVLRREADGVERGLALRQRLQEEGRCNPRRHPTVGLLQGWAQAHSGRLDQGIAAMRQALAEPPWPTPLFWPQEERLLAEALGQAGQVKEGLALLNEGLAYSASTKVAFAEAELRRLQGELRLQRGDDPEDVEACYRQAIAVAQGQQARAWELRATTSLARLLRDQGRVAEAREALAAIYGWFTEGFDTPDLVEARALLAELG